MKKFDLDLVGKEKLIFICRVRPSKKGIAFPSLSDALKSFKENFKDLLIFPVTDNDYINALKNIEYYYHLYKKNKHCEFKDKFEKILRRNGIIDKKKKLQISLENKNLNKQRVVLIEKNVRKELELNNIFLEINDLN